MTQRVIIRIMDTEGEKKKSAKKGQKINQIYSALAASGAPVLVGPRALCGVPVWKPFLNRLLTVLRYLILPVPVVFLRLAFSDQLYFLVLAAG